MVYQLVCDKCHKVLKHLKDDYYEIEYNHRKEFKVERTTYCSNCFPKYWQPVEDKS